MINCPTFHRKKDVLNETEHLEHLVTYTNVPVFQGCTGRKRQEPTSKFDGVADLSISIGTETGMIQVDGLLPLDIVYSDTHNPGTIGKIWEDHHTQLANLISHEKINKVYEIGGGHGILYKKYCNKSFIDWTIIDPAADIIKAGPKVILKFFGSDTEIPDDVDCIVHSHLLEHLYNPTEFFDKLSQLKFGTRLIFSVPNSKVHLKRKNIHAISFEHTYLIDEKFITYWLRRSGYAVQKKIMFGDYHSIFYVAAKISDAESPIPVERLCTSVPDNYVENKQIMLDYIEFWKEELNNLNDITSAIQSKMGYPNVWLFGAHVNSQFLLSQGLNGIVGILDNDSNKQNNRLYGTDHKIESPLVLGQIINPNVIVKMGPYSSEVIEQLIKINPNVNIIT